MFTGNGIILINMSKKSYFRTFLEIEFFSATDNIGLDLLPLKIYSMFEPFIYKIFTIKMDFTKGLFS
jgi:hypothetical protein